MNKLTFFGSFINKLSTRSVCYCYYRSNPFDNWKNTVIESDLEFDMDVEVSKLKRLQEKYLASLRRR
jgi:hypothetical protein